MGLAGGTASFLKFMPCDYEGETEDTGDIPLDHKPVDFHERPSTRNFRKYVRTLLTSAVTLSPPRVTLLFFLIVGLFVPLVVCKDTLPSHLFLSSGSLPSSVKMEAVQRLTCFNLTFYKF